jgi:hypothetical protein
MIIDITKSGYQKGYLAKEGVGAFHPFFATANAAFRKEALARVGGFDPQCATGEDVDLSIRVAKAGYELWFEPSARITHYHRYTMKGLLKQWFDYGRGHAYLFRKQLARPRLQLYRRDRSGRKESGLDIACVLDCPTPIHAMLFLSSYHAMHGAFALALAARAFSQPALAAAALGVGLCFGWRYFGNPLEGGVRSLALAGIRYLADGAYVLGGVLGGIKERVIYLEATRSRPQAGDPARRAKPRPDRRSSLLAPGD